ncbi:MAG: hypothetical protein M3R63_04735 [Actinomycetota bacterium]|nr:hypothetical protein [Actinomycetota bacterium]
MPRLSGLRRAADRSRHRLGTPGLVHCADHPEVAVALAALQRPWLLVLLVRARHSAAGRRWRVVANRPVFAPAT